MFVRIRLEFKFCNDYIKIPMFGGVEAVEPGTMISQAKKRLSRLRPMMSFPVRL